MKVSFHFMIFSLHAKQKQISIFYPSSFKFLFLLFLDDGQIGEGIVTTPEKLEVTKDSTGDGTITAAIDQADRNSIGSGGTPIKRPESATSGELSSSLNPDANLSNAAIPNVDQSPARSPHARSWTVPGVYL